MQFFVALLTIEASEGDPKSFGKGVVSPINLLIGTRVHVTYFSPFVGAAIRRGSGGEMRDAGKMRAHAIKAPRVPEAAVFVVTLKRGPRRLSLASGPCSTSAVAPMQPR